MDETTRRGFFQRAALGANAVSNAAQALTAEPTQVAITPIDPEILEAAKVGMMTNLQDAYEELGDRIWDYHHYTIPALHDLKSDVSIILGHPIPDYKKHVHPSLHSPDTCEQRLTDAYEAVQAADRKTRKALASFGMMMEKHPEHFTALPTWQELTARLPTDAHHPVYSSNWNKMESTHLALGVEENPAILKQTVNPDEFIATFSHIKFWNDRDNPARCLPERYEANLAHAKCVDKILQAIRTLSAHYSTQEKYRQTGTVGVMFDIVRGLEDKARNAVGNSEHKIVAWMADQLQQKVQAECPNLVTSALNVAAAGIATAGGVAFVTGLAAPLNTDTPSEQGPNPPAKPQTAALEHQAPDATVEAIRAATPLAQEKSSVERPPRL